MTSRNGTLLAICLAVGAMVFAGCESTDSGTTAKPDAPAQSAPAESAPAKSTAKPKPVLAKCLKKLKLTLDPEPSTIADRAAVGSVGSIPARYLGVIQYKGTPVLDVWIADNNRDAVETADALDIATAEMEHKKQVEVAFNNGRVIGANYNNDAYGEMPDDVPAGIDSCLSDLNDI